jgi:DNA/RNA endonuclease YhcR with UshA esterase domain
MKKSLALSRMSLALMVLAIGVSLLPTSAMACTKTVTCIRDYGDGDGIIEVGEYVEFDIVIHTENYWATTAENVRLHDRFGAELMVVSWTAEGTFDNDPDFYTKGKSEKVFLFWDIGTHEPGEYATLYLTMATDLNPAGHQEYTSPGCYDLNSGATVKKIYDGVQYSWETPRLKIEVVWDED